MKSVILGASLGFQSRLRPTNAQKVTSESPRGDARGPEHGEPPGATLGSVVRGHLSEEVTAKLGPERQEKDPVRRASLHERKCQVQGMAHAQAEAGEGGRQRWRREKWTHSGVFHGLDAHGAGALAGLS